MKKTKIISSRLFVTVCVCPHSTFLLRWARAHASVICGVMETVGWLVDQYAHIRQITTNSDIEYIIFECREETQEKKQYKLQICPQWAFLNQ